jgi:hypothetical protein
VIPEEYQRFIEEVSCDVKDHIVSRKRVDESVRRISRVKFEMVFFEQVLADESQLNSVGCDERNPHVRLMFSTRSTQ